MAPPGLGSVPGDQQQPLTPENLRLGRERETWGSKDRRTGICLQGEAVSVPGVDQDRLPVGGGTGAAEPRGMGVGIPGRGAA